MRVQPKGRQPLLEILERHEVLYVVIGGAAAEARGWKGRTIDIDIVPSADPANLDRLATALNELDAKIAIGPSSPAGLAVPGGFDRKLLSTNTIWNLLTLYGPLDVTFKPSGTYRGYSSCGGSRRGVPLSALSGSPAGAARIPSRWRK